MTTTATAVVTGANKGIGKHIASQLAAAGFTVYVGSRDADRGRAAVAEIGGRARLLVLDVTDEASVTAAAEQVEALDVLVNNAGIGRTRDTAEFSQTWEVPDEDWHKMLSTHLDSTFFARARRSR